MAAKTKTIRGLKLTLDGVVHELDLTKFMFSEAMGLEEEWGLPVTQLDQILKAGGNPPLRVIGALVWLMQVRAAAAEAGVTFSEAAKTHPAGAFDFNLAEAKLEAVIEPENPTSPATRTPATRTTRAKPARKPVKRASATAAASTSDSSPTT